MKTALATKQPQTDPRLCRHFRLPKRENPRENVVVTTSLCYAPNLNITRKNELEFWTIKNSQLLPASAYNNIDPEEQTVSVAVQTLYDRNIVEGGMRIVLRRLYNNHLMISQVCTAPWNREEPDNPYYQPEEAIWGIGRVLIVNAIQIGQAAFGRLPEVELTCLEPAAQEFFGKIGLKPMPREMNSYYFPEPAMRRFVQNFIARYGIE